ncbi:MAG: hypothetical protein EOO77_46405 [Oxalobacteraceae bacterium]|nr:MAG: hypothetical protein EOO77_46405 [Oxalobacteraceae bacterium]
MPWSAASYPADGTAVFVGGKTEPSRVRVYIPKPDKHDAISYGVDVELDCKLKLQRKVASNGKRPDNSIVHLP